MSDLEDDKKNWLASPYTQHVVKELRAKEQLGINFLMARASSSTDPQVRDAYRGLQEVRELIRQLTEQPEPT